MKRKLFSLVLVLALFMLIGAAVAQDAPPETTPEITATAPAPGGDQAPSDGNETPPVFQAPSPDDVINATFVALLAAFATGILSPLTATVVSLVKRIQLGFIQNATADQINLAVAMLLSLGMWAGVHFGFGQQVTTGYQLLYAVLPILTGAGANYLSNQSAYNFAKSKRMPVVGYERPPKALRLAKN